MRYFILFILSVSGFVNAKEHQLTQQILSVSSPDKAIVLSFTDNDNVAQYQVSFNDKAVIEPSKLGFLFKTAVPMYRDFTVSEVSRNQVDTSWEQPWGEQRIIHDKHNELVVKYTHKTEPNNMFFVRARAFNDGIGFRYEVPVSKRVNF